MSPLKRREISALQFLSQTPQLTGLEINFHHSVRPVEQERREVMKQDITNLNMHQQKVEWFFFSFP